MTTIIGISLLSDIEVLNQRFAMGPQVRFGKLAEGAAAVIDNSFATARISLQGGRVVSLRPKHKSNSKLLARGYARMSPWGVILDRTPDGEATAVTLALSDTALNSGHRPRALRLPVRVTDGDVFEVALTTSNEED